MSILSSSKKQLIEFSSWGDALEYASRKPKQGISNPCSRDADHEWAGGSFKQAMDLARNGWTEGEDKVNVLSSALVDKISSLVERENIEYDVTGISLDVATFLKGEPECWQRWETYTTEGIGNSIVRIVVNGFFSAGIEQPVIIARGAVIAALVSLLELSGKRAEVILHTPFKSNNNNIQFRTTIKTADQNLDMSRLIYAVGHPSMFRRISFGHQDQHPENYYDGYGQPYELDKVDQGDIYFGCMSYGEVRWTSPESAKEFILAELKKQGVEVSNG